MLIHRIYAIVGPWFRRRRLAFFCKDFKITPSTTVLDVGGVRSHWDLAPVRPRVIVINLNPEAADVVGNACQLPFADNSFDVVYSNSVIEHVGDQQAFASEVRRVARRYWVQAPDWYSPIEPHYIGPPIHRLPKRWQRFAACWLTARGYIDRAGVLEALAEVRLPTERRMRELFPDVGLQLERVGILRKSLIVL